MRYILKVFNYLAIGFVFQQYRVVLLLLLLLLFEGGDCKGKCMYKEHWIIEAESNDPCYRKELIIKQQILIEAIRRQKSYTARLSKCHVITDTPVKNVFLYLKLLTCACVAYFHTVRNDICSIKSKNLQWISRLLLLMSL